MGNKYYRVMAVVIWNCILMIFKMYWIIKKKTAGNPYRVAAEFGKTIALIASDAAMKADKNDIKSIVKMPDILSAYGMRCDGRRIPCPLCEHARKDPPFKISSDSWRCFACNDGGDIFKFVQLMNGCDFSSALDWTCERFNIPNDSEPIPEFDRLRFDVKKFTTELARLERQGENAVLYNQLIIILGVTRPQLDVEKLRTAYKNKSLQLEQAKSRLFSGRFDKDIEKFISQRKL